MKKFLLIVFTFILFSSSASAANAQSFRCVCVAHEFGSCSSYEPEADASCPTGFGATSAACNTSPDCNGNEDCFATCAESPIPYAYGSNCNPDSPRVDCQPDPSDPLAPVDCRFTPEINYGRCLKIANALESGIPCRDSTECAGHSEGSLCVFLPGVATSRACITRVEMDTQGLNCQPAVGGSVVCEEGYTPPPPPPEAINPECEANGSDGTYTAIGCVPFNTILLAATSNAFLIGIAGSIALILLARAAFMFMTSRGDATRLGEAKETITAVIAGLLMLAFATLIYRFLAQSLLGLF